MPQVDWQFLESAENVASTAARDLLSRVAGQSAFTLGLSGGRITVELFRQLVFLCRSGAPGSREFIHATDFFWADERCVPIDDPENTFGLAQRELFAPLAIPREKIHRIPCEQDPAYGAKTAEAELCRIAPMNSEGIPMLDLLLLGMGEDGHVASLFPGAQIDPKWQNTIYRPVIGPKPPPLRVTLDYSAIAAARDVWVLVSGSGKESALAQARTLQGELPVSRVLRSRERTRVLSAIKL